MHRVKLSSWASTRSVQVGVISIACLAALAPVAANGQPRSVRRHVQYVSGHLSARGYTLAVVGYNGKTVLSNKSSFRLAAPDSKVTLQLVNSHGVYAGPVVLGGTAAKAIVGVKAGVNIGTIIVVPAKGYAHLARKLATKNLDKSRWAYANRGVPIGNGKNFGLVISKTQGTNGGAGQDPAHIGVPNEFNIAFPGTKVLKS